jgi:hypothetical protein
MEKKPFPSCPENVADFPSRADGGDLFTLLFPNRDFYSINLGCLSHVRNENKRTDMTDALRTCSEIDQYVTDIVKRERLQIIVEAGKKKTSREIRGWVGFAQLGTSSSGLALSGARTSISKTSTQLSLHPKSPSCQTINQLVGINPLYQAF